jgi:hypothetical protein
MNLRRKSPEVPGSEQNGDGSLYQVWVYNHPPGDALVDTGSSSGTNILD